MRITIIGGHGKVAMALAPLLVGDGHEVRSVVRNPAHTSDVESTGAVAVVADVAAITGDEVAELLAGSDAVVWSAGAGGGSPERTYAVDRDAAIRSMDAAVRAGARRYVMVSYLGAGNDHGVPEGNSFFPYAQAKAAADEHLRGTSLDWTILGPGSLSDDPGTGCIGVGSEARADAVPRADVAAVAREVLARPRTSGSTIGFTGGTTAIADAVAQFER